MHALLLILLLVKKIPQLVSELLSGQPQLSSSDMTGALKGAVAGAAAATGNIAAATGKGGLGGTLTQLGRNYMMSRSPVRSYRDAIGSFQRTKDNSGLRILQKLRTGVDSRNRQTANAAQSGNNTNQN